MTLMQQFNYQSTSEYAKTFSSLQEFDVGQRFLEEARFLLEIECGRRSLTTVQALLVIYACYVSQGKDRGGILYRHMAYDMLSHLRAKLETSPTNTKMAEGRDTARYGKAMSRTLWGIYCFERYGKSVSTESFAAKLT